MSLPLVCFAAVIVILTGTSVALRSRGYDLLNRFYHFEREDE